MTQQVVTASAVPEINVVTFADLTQALRQGWRDFTLAPMFGLFFASVYVLGGWVMYLALTVSGQLWWTLPAAVLVTHASQSNTGLAPIVFGGILWPSKSLARARKVSTAYRERS